jgi:Mg2+ and Co2+ transporter CorA
VAGVFGMNFETPYTQTGVIGFWIVISALGAFISAAIILAQRRDWI